MIIKNYKLTNQNINDAVSDIQTSLQTKKFNKFEVLRVVLKAEELLLDCQMRFGNEYDFTLRINLGFFRAKIEILVKGDSFDPFDVDEDALIHKIKVKIEYDPVWVYDKGTNNISFSIRKDLKISDIVQIIISIVLGVVLGLLSTTLPNDIGEKIGEVVFSPLSETIMAFLTATSGMFIFLSILNGLASIGDASTFNTIGKKTIFHLLKMLLFYTIISVVVLIPFAHINLNSSGSIDFQMFYKMILDTIPPDFVSPFANGNILQIVFLSICTAIAMIFLGIKVYGLVEIISQVNQVMKMLVIGVTKFLPLVVFVSFYNMAASGTINTIGKSYKLILYELLVSFAYIAFCLIRLYLSKNVNPWKFFRNLSKTLTIMCSTASSAATLPTLLDESEQRFGIDKKYANFAFPLEQGIFKTGVAGLLVCSSFCMADIYKIALTPMGIVTIIISSFFLAIATPPVAGGLITCIGMLFTQLGIPAGGLAIYVALDAITERIGCAPLIITFEAETIQLAGTLNLLDKDILEAHNKG